MKKTILVIDDDATVTTLIVKLLQSKGYAVTGFTDPVEGLEHVPQLCPDLVICDVVMPSMSGYELLETLRKTPATASIPLMFLTSKSSRKDVMEGIDLGADNYLSKPVDNEEVLAAVAARFADLEPNIPATNSSQLKFNIPPELQSEYSGWWAAVEPTSNRCFLGKTRQLAYQAALRAYPSGIFFYQELKPALARAEVAA